MKYNANTRICIKCVLGLSDDPFISFDDKGICNHCYTYEHLLARYKYLIDNREQELKKLIDQIKKSKKGKYDCIIGVSGGIDSTYLAYLVKQWGLNPLSIHFDNGWNSTLSEQNVAHIIDILGYDLYRYKVDWDEFKDIQRSYLKASVVDIEAPTDHAIFSLLHQAAKKYNVKYILSGASTFTEGYLPNYWVYNKKDFLNIKSIQKRFGSKKIKSLPHTNLFKWFYYVKIKGIKTVTALDYVDYQKKEAKAIIKEALNWQDYPEKHGESIFTQFYQAYILPRKFGIDKRKGHYSTLICANQMTREEALGKLSSDQYNENTMSDEKKYVLDRLGFTEDEFEKIMAAPRIEHTAYASIKKYFILGSRIKRLILPKKK